MPPHERLENDLARVMTSKKHCVPQAFGFLEVQLIASILSLIKSPAIDASLIFYGDIEKTKKNRFACCHIDPLVKRSGSSMMTVNRANINPLMLAGSFCEARALPQDAPCAAPRTERCGCCIFVMQGDTLKPPE